MKTLLLGLGNPILTDDGVGVRIVQAAASRLPPDSPIETAELSLGGLTLMERMVGYERVILVDSIRLEGVPTGSFRRMSLEDLQRISPTQHSASPHDASLVTALETGRRMGLPLPKEIVIFAVQVENAADFGEALTPAVAAAVPSVVEAILAELERA